MGLPTMLPMMSEEEKQHFAQMEQARRIGHNFIRVAYRGRSQFPRPHGLHTVEAYESTDDDGMKIWKVKEGARALEFRPDGLGNLIEDVLDDEHNRFWLARHIDYGIEVSDPRVAEEIRSLVNVPYKVELDGKDALRRQIAQMNKELQALESQEEKAEPPKEEPKTPAPDKKPGWQGRQARRNNAKKRRESKRKALSDALNAKEAQDGHDSGTGNMGTT